MFKKIIGQCFLLVFCFTIPICAFSFDNVFDKNIRRLMHKGNIPGIAIIVVSNDASQIQTFGYSNIENKELISSKSLFEIGSCSKSFTALAIMQLHEKGILNINDTVKKYFPNFNPTYKGIVVDITVEQLLNQTSGIPWETISLIPIGNAKNALTLTVERLNNIKLEALPGQYFNYATVNYALLGAVIEKATAVSYEQYMTDNIFIPLGLHHTLIRDDTTVSMQMTTGYKIGFNRPLRYDAPIFRGNNPAGYVITNAIDMEKWLKYQLGLINSEFSESIKKTHIPNYKNNKHANMTFFYAKGWFISYNNGQEIFHGGLNPNYSTYIIFRPEDKVAVAVMTNSNSDYVSLIANYVLALITHQEIPNLYKKNSGSDTLFTTLTMIFLFLILVVFCYIFFIIKDILHHRRSLKFTKVHIIAMTYGILLFIPLIVIIGLIPKYMNSITWNTALIWGGVSFPCAIFFIIASYFLICLLFLFMLSYYPASDYKIKLPLLILISSLSGIGNAAVIMLVTKSILNKDNLWIMIAYFVISLMAYVFGRKFVQTELLYITLNLIDRFRLDIINRLLNTSYLNFEKLERGRIYSTVNNDITSIGAAPTLLITISTSLATIMCIIIYLFSISFKATLITITVISIIALLYHRAGRIAQKYFEIVRDTRNIFMSLINGMLDGFKELSLHSTERLSYYNDICENNKIYIDKTKLARLKFINTHIIGEIFLILVLGFVCFAIPIISSDLDKIMLIAYVVALLYLIGPINAVLQSISPTLELKVSWKRIHSLINDITNNANVYLSENYNTIPSVDSFSLNNIHYTYDNGGFCLGPINLDVNKGEILFIIGGNGSGKTTLAKIMTGLYPPSQGTISINNKILTNSQVGELFSVVYNDFYLFEKLYGLELSNREDDIKRYLNTLNLSDVVSIENNKFSTIKLSGGQRKRLALLKCYLDSRSIFLFDEIAADQDPDFRKYFYTVLLPAMRAEKKVIIAITHDDHYFYIADKIIKLEEGKVDYIKYDPHKA